MHLSGGEEYAFRGCFPEVRPDELIAQTSTWEGTPDGVALEELVLEELPGGRCRLTAQFLRGRRSLLTPGPSACDVPGKESP